jgi:3',5'-cyclic AMP phosphodiesterase CpdA
MSRLVHLSDLHFGRARPELLAPLSAAIRAADPDLVVVSGDLTQRARSREFAAARQFLDGLGARWLSVPGNHDIPLYQPWDRMLAPFRKYRENIALELEPVHEGPDYQVAGLNTVDRFAGQRGRARGHAVRRICGLLGQGDAQRFDIVVAHHPFEQDKSSHKKPMRRAEPMLEKLSSAGAHVVLSGHLHMWHTGPFLTRAGRTGPIQVHAGTSLSSRLRGEVNDFAVLDIEGHWLTVTRMAVGSESTEFKQRTVAKFKRDGAGLVPAPGSEIDGDAGEL